MALNAHFASAHVRWRFILFKYYLWSVYALGVLHPLPHAGLTHASRLGFGAWEYHAKSIRKLLLQPSRGREDGWCGGRGGRDACFQRTHFGGQGKAVRRRSRKG